MYNKHTVVRWLNFGVFLAWKTESIYAAALAASFFRWYLCRLNPQEIIEISSSSPWIPLLRALVQVNYITKKTAFPHFLWVCSLLFVGDFFYSPFWKRLGKTRQINNVLYCSLNWRTLASSNRYNLRVQCTPSVLCIRILSLWIRRLPKNHSTQRNGMRIESGWPEVCSGLARPPFMALPRRICSPSTMCGPLRHSCLPYDRRPSQVQ